MNYPIEILPNPNFKRITCDLSNCYLLRYTSTVDIIDPLTGYVKDEFVAHPSENVKDLSTSLFGVFKLQHNSIELTDRGKSEYGSYCAPDIRVNTPSFGYDYLIAIDRGYLAIKIGDIHRKECVKISESGVERKATCIVTHTPAKWNYWHFSVNWKVDDTYWHEADAPTQRKISRWLRHEARTIIKIHAKDILPIDAKKVNPNDFCKSLIRFYTFRMKISVVQAKDAFKLRISRFLKRA